MAAVSAPTVSFGLGLARIVDLFTACVIFRDAGSGREFVVELPNKLSMMRLLFASLVCADESINGPSFAITNNRTIETPTNARNNFIIDRVCYFISPKNSGLYFVDICLIYFNH